MDVFTVFAIGRSTPLGSALDRPHGLPKRVLSRVSGTGLKAGAAGRVFSFRRGALVPACDRLVLNKEPALEKLRALPLCDFPELGLLKLVQQPSNSS